MTRTILAAGLVFGLAAPAAADDVIYLDQGWGKAERDRVYRVPQGSEIVPYAWFLALEQALSESPFGDAANIEALRFLPEPKGAANPDGLPVGFAKGVTRKGEEWIGLTCAACHTGQFTFRGKTVRVDGGSGQPDLIAFQSALLMAFKATVAQPAKFDRFARRVLGDGAAPEQVKALADRVRVRTRELADWEARNRPAHLSGFGTFDALNVLMNATNATSQGEVANYRVPRAPVSYPSIWLTPEYDWMLWNAGIQNQLSRGLGEVIGVFGDLRVTKAEGGGLKYESTADLKRLDELYTHNYSLKPPAWPAAVLGDLDPEKVKRGAEVYAREGCAKCHAEKAPYPRTAPNAAGATHIKIARVPLKEIGTDPVYVESFLTRTSVPGLMAPVFEGTPLAKQPAVPAALLFLDTLNKTTLAGLDQITDDPKLRARLLGSQPLPKLPGSEAELAAMSVLAGYRAAPLAGVWATAPYLHNASVPTLHDLLLPPEQRPKEFTLGNREFDPVKVGNVTTPFDGGYRFDTTLPGFSNAGHRYGTGISDEDRRALIEYLKTL